MTRTSYPSYLTDTQWSIIAPLIPPDWPGGRYRSVDMREVINGILYLNPGSATLPNSGDPATVAIIEYDEENDMLSAKHIALG